MKLIVNIKIFLWMSCIFILEICWNSENYMSILYQYNFKQGYKNYYSINLGPSIHFLSDDSREVDMIVTRY